MATQVEAARLLTHRAARMKDAGERSDIEAGMAKLFASETGRFCAEECLRIHGGYGYSKEYEIERIYRDAPLLLIGEGTSRDPAHGDRAQAARAPQDLEPECVRRDDRRAPRFAKLSLRRSRCNGTWPDHGSDSSH